MVYAHSHPIRFITRMDASESILRQKGRRLLLDFKANGRAGYGTRRFDTIAERILPIDDCESKVVSSSDPLSLKH